MSSSPHVLEPIGWLDQAACRGKTSLFFPKRAERPEARQRRETQARKICAGCDVRIECRSWARANREYGFWGGENEEERTDAGFPVPNPIGVRRKSA